MSDSAYPVQIGRGLQTAMPVVVVSGDAGGGGGPGPSTNSRGGYGATTRLLDFGAGSYSVVNETPISETIGDYTEICISPSVPIFIATGAPSGPGAGSMYLPAAPHYIQVNPGDVLSIASVTGEGFVTVTPVAV